MAAVLHPGGLQASPAGGSLPKCVNTPSGSGLQASEPFVAEAGQRQRLGPWITRQAGWETSSMTGISFRPLSKRLSWVPGMMCNGCFCLTRN
jgi:hypothetical protein